MTIAARPRPRPAAQPATARGAPPCGDGSLLVHLLRYAAEVTSNCPALLDELAALFPDRAPRPGRGAARPTARFALLGDVAPARAGGPDAGGAYVVRQADGVASGFASAAAALAHLEYRISEEAIACHARRLLIHAAVAATPTGGILIPGASGAGKSTLVAALACRGMAYLSDEVAVVAVRSATLLPFPKPIRLRDGGWRALQAGGAAPAPHLEATLPDSRVIRYVVAPRRAEVGRRVPVRHIVIPRRRRGAAALVAATRAGTVAELARHALNLPRHGRAGVACLVRMVERSTCHWLMYDDVWEAATMIADLTARRHDPRRIPAAAVPGDDTRGAT
jgi:hypothetical protein